MNADPRMLAEDAHGPAADPARSGQLQPTTRLGSECRARIRQPSRRPSRALEPTVEIVPDHDLAGALEAVLLVVDAPVTEAALATAVGHPPARVRDVLLDAGRPVHRGVAPGIELRELGGGWRFYTRDRFAPVVERFVLDGAQSRLSRAALETLAVVAYRQPVTRARVAGGPRGQRRRCRPHADVPRADRGRRRRRRTPADCCTAPPSCSWSGLVCPTCRNCRRSARCCPISTGSTMSDQKKPAGRSTRKAGRPTGSGRSETVRPRPAKADVDAASIDPPDELTAPTASGCRRCWPRPGVASRRKAEELIKAGRVKVDGIVVNEMGSRIDPDKAVVHVDGNRVVLREDQVYLALNKMPGMLSTMSDELGRPNIGQLLEDRPERLFHVGRLDMDSEGLLLLTNDGDLAHRLTHPSYGVAKTYMAEIPGPVPRDLGRRLRAGRRTGRRPGEGRLRSRSSTCTTAAPWSRSSCTRAASTSSGGCWTPSTTRCPGWSGPRSARCSSVTSGPARCAS